MKKLLLTLLAVVGLSAVATAETSTLTLTQNDQKAGGDLIELKTNGNDNIKADDGDITWDFTMTKKNTDFFLGWDTNTTAKGVQFGSSKQPITNLTIQSTGFADKSISSVTINISGASKILATASVTVGETAFQNSGSDTYSLTTTATNVSFTGSANGEVIITITNTSDAAVYVKSISVEYTKATTGTASPNIAFEQEDYYVCIDDIATFQSPKLKNPNGITSITYDVSNPNFASVDENGIVTIKKAEIGSFFLYAIFEGDDTYAAKTASCEITVTEEKYYTVEFDFENEDYGMTRLSGDQTQRNPENTCFGCEWIKCYTNAETVLWETASGNKSLRVFQNGEIMIESPENTNIESVSIYHFSADGDPEDVSMDADHEHVVDIAGNIAILSGQTEWEAEHHKVSKIEVVYSCKQEVMVAVENAFKAAPAEHFTIKVDGVEQTGSTISIDQTKTEGVNLELSHYYPHATIYTKFTPKASSETQGMYYDALEGYTAHTQALPLTQEGTLNYYAELNGHQTAVQTLTVSDPTSTSIADIQAAGAAEYFDMQGRRVNAPANGIFIRKQGNKAVKVSL